MRLEIKDLDEELIKSSVCHCNAVWLNSGVSADKVPVKNVR